LSVAAKGLLRAYPNRAATLENLEQFADEISAALYDVCTHLHPEFPDFCRADYFIELAAHAWMHHSGTGNHDERLMPVATIYATWLDGWAMTAFVRLTAKSHLENNF
jgi:hypothetical protein